MRAAGPILLLAAGLLAGCQAAAPADRRPAPVAAAAGLPPRSATESPPGAAESADLSGLDQAALQQRFGAPALRRQDGDALVLAYHRPGCVLHLFLYPDDRGAPRVRHADAIGTDRRRQTVAACLS